MATITKEQIREMNDPVIERKPVGGFFRNMMFNREKNHVTDLIDIDLWKGQRRVAPYCKVSDKATPFDRIKGTTGAFKIPNIKLKRTIAPGDLLDRGVGEAVYSSKSPMQRGNEVMAQDLIDLDDAIARAEEIQCAQAVIDGKVVIKGTDIDAEVDMQRDATLFLLPAALPSTGWTTANDILADLRFMRRRSFAVSGRSPSTVIMGSAAAEVFLKNIQIADMLDNRRLDAGAVTLPNGVKLENIIFYGNVGGFDFYEYNELFDDPNNNNTVTNVMATDKVVLASMGSRCVAHYAPIMDMKSLMPERRFSKWVDLEDPSVRELIMQSRPLMVTEEPDAFVTADVIV